MKSRYEELDSLRGIASIMVLMMHFLSVFPYYGKQIMYSSISYIYSFLWAGHSAVILFFVLSGYVLTVSLMRNSIGYLPFLIKRVCRIYIPYIIVFLCTLITINIISSKIGNVPGLVDWAFWDEKLTVHNFLQHLLFLGEYNTNAYLNIIWTLVHEMRISLVFPLMLLIVQKVNWKLSLLIAMVLSTTGYTLFSTIPTQQPNLISTNYFVTLHYSSFFILGSILALNITSIIEILKNNKLRYFVYLTGFLLFIFPSFPFSIQSKITGEIPYNLYLIFIDWYIGLGAILLVAAILNSKKLAKILSLKFIKTIGNVSYSIYLLHVWVLLTLVHLFYGYLPIYIILLIAFGITILFSFYFHKYVELPSIFIGKYFSKNISPSAKMPQIQKKAL